MNIDEPTPFLVWADLETTGLYPAAPEAAVLEIAAVLTDSDLAVCGAVPPFETVVAWDGDPQQLHPAVVEMHTANGLLDATRSPDAVSAADADRLWAEWCDTAAAAVGAERLTLAGSTPSFDMAWIGQHLPYTRRRLHYRLFDASTLRQAALWWADDTLGADPDDQAVHRAMDDIRASLTFAVNARALIVPRLHDDGF